jgi:uncharacterized protein (TIGR02271 family)
MSMSLHAEATEIGKRRIEELVTVKRVTRTKSVLVEEALNREDVLVEHVHVGEFVDAMPSVREEGGTTILPIVEEVAVIVKRLFLREEVRITRTRTTSQHVETVTLREQHAQVTRTPLPADAGGGSTLLNQPNPKGIPNMENEEIIVAVYDTHAHADLAVGDLLQAKVPEHAISRHQGSSTATGAAPIREKGFWASLFGGDAADDEHIYERSAQSGSSVVVVRTPTHDADAVIEILERHNPINIDERAASYGAATGTMTPGTTSAAGSTVTTGYDPAATATANPVATVGYADRTVSAAATGEIVQLAEERLVVGKRLVNRGGTRLRRYVVETPVQEDVSLRSETVNVERRPVTGGAVTDPDFSEKTIEMTASAEEAVVGKTAHVVEEVSLRKQAGDRVETVRDTVRKEDIEVEKIPAEDVAETTTTAGAPLDPRAPRI